MKDKSKEIGFEYFLEEDVLEDYKKKPLEKRLQWLYAGNKLRMLCPEEVKERHAEFRKPIENQGRK